MNSLEVILKIVHDSPLIKSMSFHEFPKQTLVQERNMIWGSKEQVMFENALEFKKTGMPFWDGIMLSAFNNPCFSAKLLQQALYHNTKSQLIYILKENFATWLSKMDLYYIDTIALCSRVIMTNDEEQHLPLIDFHIPVSDTNLLVVESVCRLLGLDNGWILNSGESYHFIGSKPIFYNEIEQLLYKAIMFTPIIDKAWISHQLREQSCSLRVGRKRGQYPIVVKQI